MDIWPVGASKRTLGGGDFFLLWAGVAISLAEIWAGGFLAPMGFLPAVGAILLGHLIGNTLMALGGTIGSDQGIMSMVSVRPSFGLRGAGLAALLNIVQLVCWASIMLIIGGRAGAMLGAGLGGVWASNDFWIVTIGLGTLIWALFTGNRVWKILQSIAVLGLLGVVTILTVETYQAFVSGGPFRQPGEGMPFMIGVDLVIAMPISWLPLVADYARFARNGRHAFWNTWGGYFLVSSWMFLLGLMATMVAGNPEPHFQLLRLMGAAGLVVPALSMVVLSTVTSDFPDIYSATCSILNVSEKIPPKIFMWVTGILSIVVALVFPMDRYESFLYLIGAMFVPLFGIVLTDYFCVRRRQLDLDALYARRGPYWYRGGFHPTALVAWGLGFGTYKLFELARYPLGSSIPSILVSGLVYYLATASRKSGA